jgi:hypothetical protein
MCRRTVFCPLSRARVSVENEVRAFSSEVDSGSREENASKQKINAPYQGFPTGSVIRRIARASFGASQRMSLVSDIASTIEEATPILVM